LFFFFAGAVFYMEEVIRLLATLRTHSSAIDYLRLRRLGNLLSLQLSNPPLKV
jgi:hypothetical protein